MRLKVGTLVAILTISSVVYATEEVVEKEYSRREARRIKRMGVEAELISNVKAIKQAQIVYDSNNDKFVSAEQYPSEPNRKGTDWVVESSGGFATLGWAPDGKVRGAYSVELFYHPYNGDFTVQGIGDIDGDGTMETYRATKSNDPISKIR